MKIKTPKGFKKFASARAKDIVEMRKDKGSPLNYYFEESGEYSALKVHVDDDGNGVLEIYDSIGYWITDQDVATALRNFTGTKLEVRLNTPGGDVFMGIAIADIISSHPAFCTARIHGVCASIGTAISLGCDVVEMVTGSQYMVHPASTFMYANASEAREIADWLDNITDGIMDLYEERTDMERSKIEEMVAAETWLSPKEAKDAGFVDRIVKLKSAKQEEEPPAEEDEDSEALAQAKAKRQRQVSIMKIKSPIAA